MNNNIIFYISQYLTHLQNVLFPFFKAEHLELTPLLEKVIRVLEFIKIERFIPTSKGYVGRPQKDRIAIARAFVAKAVLNLPTTEMLIERLQIDLALRRICGFESVKDVPDASRFSRAFAEFAELQLPAKVHEALIHSMLGDCVFEHNAIDSTVIEAREKPMLKAKSDQTTEVAAVATIPEAGTNCVLALDTETTATFDDAVINPVPADKSTMVSNPSVALVSSDTADTSQPGIDLDAATATSPDIQTTVVPASGKATIDKRKKAKRKRGRPSKKAIVVAEKPIKKKRGRPRKGEEKPKVPTLIETQIHKSIAQAIANLPTACDIGCKKNSKGHSETWIGYKLHIGTVDGDIPIAAVITSASVHDNQVAIPLMRMGRERVNYSYDLADAAYCSGVIRDESRRLGHVPLIDHNPRNGDKIEFLPHEAEHYKSRSQAERVNSMLKDNHGGRHVRVKGAPKVFSHLMFGILVIAAEQILRLIN